MDRIEAGEGILAQVNSNLNYSSQSLTIDSIRRTLESLSTNDRNFNMWTGSEGIRTLDEYMINYAREIGFIITNDFNTTCVMIPEEAFSNEILSIEELEEIENNNTIMNL